MEQSGAVVSRDWLTRDEAIETLGKSRSTLERLVEMNEIATKPQPVEGRRPMTLYRRADVQRVAAAPPLARSTPKDSQPLAELAGALRALLERNATPQLPPAPAVPITEKLWLSLSEAMEYSGLARADLLNLCHISEKAINPPLKVRRSGGWKIQRRSLDEFEGWIPFE